MMFQLRVNTNTNRFPAEMENMNTTVADAIKARNISLQGAVLQLNGRIIPETEFGKTFEALGVKEDSMATLSVVVKANSAAV